MTFLSELRLNLLASRDSSMRYNIPLVNALVLYVGTQAIAHIRSKNHHLSPSTVAHSAHMDIFQHLAIDLDTEGRYLFLNAIANQLRYPNIHTHYFSCTFLYLFSEANNEAIQEQITRSDAVCIRTTDVDKLGLLNSRSFVEFCWSASSSTAHIRGACSSPSLS